MGYIKLHFRVDFNGESYHLSITIKVLKLRALWLQRFYVKNRDNQEDTRWCNTNWRVQGYEKVDCRTIWKGRHTTLVGIEQANSAIKKLRKSSNNGIEQMLHKWFCQQRSNNVTISWAILHSKAKELGNAIENSTNFQYNRSWIDRFEKRHGITCGKIVGESLTQILSVIGYEKMAKNQRKLWRLWHF